MKRIISLLSLIVIFFNSGVCIADLMTGSIGSDAMVNRFDTIQLVTNDCYRIAGFASLDAGFILQSVETTGTFDSFFQVSGPIGLNGGTLNLNQDLILYNEASLTSLGDINGNFHSLDLSKSVTCIPNESNIVLECGVEELLRQDTAPGQVETVDWSFDDEFIAAGLNGSGGSDTLKIFAFNGLTLTEKFSGSPQGDDEEVVSVRWSPVGHPYDSTKYFIAVCRERDFTPDFEFFIAEYDSVAMTLTVLDGRGVSDDVNAVEWHPSGDYLAVITQSGDLTVYPVDSAGMLGTPVTNTPLNVGEDVETQVMGWDVTGEYLAVGLENPGGMGGMGEVQIYTFDVGTETLNPTPTTFAVDEDVRSVSWNKVFPTILAVATNEGSSNDDALIVLEHDGSGGTLTKKSGLPSSDFDNDLRSVNWSPDGLCLAMSQKKADNEKEFRIYSYNPATFELTDLDLGTGLDDGFTFDNEVESVRWSHNNGYVVNGSDVQRITVYLRNGFIPDGYDEYGNQRCFNFSNLCLFLNCDLCLKNCCIKFSGKSTIGGRGNCLTLEPSCRILVDADSTLLIKDITIKGIAGENIQGCADTSTFLFENVEWVQNDDYTFGLGSFAVIKDFDVVGDGHTFSYDSDQVSTIEKCGCMNINQGVTFKYNPGGADQDRIQLIDSTSKLALCGGTLNVMEPGWNLTTGQFIVKNRSFICAQEYGPFIIGDGSYTENNLNVQIFPAANLEITKGCVLYNNVQ